MKIIKIKNSDKFREPILRFIENGRYSPFPDGTLADLNYWIEEQNRSIHGYTAADGDWISGYNYFYLNYCQIERLVRREIKYGKHAGEFTEERETFFPDFYDYDYNYFLMCDEAEKSNKHMVVLKKRGSGYEQPYSEDVLTPNGFVKMGTLKAGDYVMNPNGGVSMIGEIVEQGYKPVFEVELADGRKVECGENHLWTVITKNKYRVLSTSELMSRKLKSGIEGKAKYNYKLPPINPLRLQESTQTHIDPYVLGVLIGDGGMTRSSTYFYTDDDFIVDEVSRRMQDYDVFRNNGARFKCVIKSKNPTTNNLTRHIKDLGLNVHSYDKFIPKEYLYSSIDDRMDLLRGLMDTDGSCTKGSCSFVSSSERLIDDVEFLVRSLGIRCHKSNVIKGRDSVDFGNGSISKTRDRWELTITTDKDIFLLPRKLKNIRTDRKYDFNLIAIKSIKKLDKVENQRCICIDDENHLYITRNFVPTHNSFKAAAMLCRNYFCIEKSKSYAVASTTEFLLKDGILTKAWDIIDFIDTHTGFAKRRDKSNSKLERVASYIETDEYGRKIEKGYKSAIIGISTGDSTGTVRGKRGKLYILEEAGSFPDITTVWNTIRPSVEDGGRTFGLIVAQGCVCEGTKVCTSDGRTINIEDLKEGDGIVGHDSDFPVQQKISAYREPYNTECYRITLDSGRTLECSHDHPIVFSRGNMSKRVPGRRKFNEHMKYWKFKEASKFIIGDQVGVADMVDVFGENRMWNPRLIGWLIGDGSYGFDKTPVLSNCEEEINSYIDENFNTAIEKSYETKDGKLYRETRIKDICKRLMDLGIYGQTKDKKRLPELIYSCTKDDICELIGGFFDTDGHIALPKGKTGFKIRLASAYKSLLIDMLHLLQKIGVHAKIRFVKPNQNNKLDRNGYYSLEIADIKSMKRFVEDIKFFPKEKSRRAEIYKHSLKEKSGQTSKYIEGIRFEKVVSIESIGIKKVYNLTADGTNTYIANGIITHNTGGDKDSKFAGLKKMFYDPDSFNVLPIENSWDEGLEGQKCCFFVPEYANLSTLDKDGTRLFMDEDGNTIERPSIDFVMARRAEITDQEMLDKYVAEHPLTPQESMLDYGGNIFPKKQLMVHLSSILSSKKLTHHKQVGELDYIGGVLQWNVTKGGDVTEYPLREGMDKTGSIVIWEHPDKEPPNGLYICGIDPYDFDTANYSSSLGSMIVYKRFQDFESYYDLPVAEYTGRPTMANDFYENCRKLAMYYNARILYENEKKGLHTYFQHKHSEHLLVDQPDILSDIVKGSKVNRKKGIHMSTPIIDWSIGKLNEWLREEFSPGHMNLEKIFSVPLLQELIAYNPKGNFDRVRAFQCVMILKEQMHNRIVKDNKAEDKAQTLFEAPFFAQNKFK